MINFGGEPSAGTPGGPSPTATLRGLIDQALLLSNTPGHLEPTAGGTAPSRMLGDFAEAALSGLYAATGQGLSVEQWLADALDVDEHQLAIDGPPALARLLDASFEDPEAAFSVRPMSIEEDREDLARSMEALEEFASIPDDLPRDTP